MVDLMLLMLAPPAQSVRMHHPISIAVTLSQARGENRANGNPSCVYRVVNTITGEWIRARSFSLTQPRAKDDFSRHVTIRTPGSYTVWLRCGRPPLMLTSNSVTITVFP